MRSNRRSVFHGLDPDECLVELTPRDGETTLRTSDIVEFIDREKGSIALILIGGVNYFTGQAFETREITEAGHRAGAIVGFDLAHAGGNLELKMHDWGVDFAVWCTYKYLNGGPGAVGGALIHERRADCDWTRLVLNAVLSFHGILGANV